MGFLKKYRKLLIFLLILGGIFFWAYTPDISLEDMKEEYANEHSRFTEIQGMPVHYRDEGDGEAIVLLHGSGASLHTWEDWTQELIKNYRVIRLDLSGFGLTGPQPDKDYSMGMYTELVSELLNKLQVSSFHIAGNSLGGNIAWRYAVKHPEQIKTMTLLDATGYRVKRKKPANTTEKPKKRKTSWVFRALRNPFMRSVLKKVTPKFLIRSNLEQVYYDDTKVTDQLIERYHDMLRRTGNRQAYIDRFTVKRTRTDETPKLKNLDTPTLIIWGEQDLWVPLAVGELFDKNMPNSKLVVMKETGHLPMEERPMESVALMLDFISNQTPLEDVRNQDEL